MDPKNRDKKSHHPTIILHFTVTSATASTLFRKSGKRQNFQESDGSTPKKYCTDGRAREIDGWFSLLPLISFVQSQDPGTRRWKLATASGGYWEETKTDRAVPGFSGMNLQIQITPITIVDTGYKAIRQHFPLTYKTYNEMALYPKFRTDLLPAFSDIDTFAPAPTLQQDMLSVFCAAHCPNISMVRSKRHVT